MSIICIVCRDPLTSNPEPGAEADWDGHRSETMTTKIVVTGCGHAYHEYCLTKWTRDHPGCPYCSANVVAHTLRKVFPVGDEDSQELDTTVSSLRRELETLRFTSMEMDEELGDVRHCLEEKQTELEVLRVDFACMERNMETSRTQMEEMATMLAEANGRSDQMETDYQRQIEALKQDVKEAKQRQQPTVCLTQIRLAYKYATETQVILNALLEGQEKNSSKVNGVNDPEVITVYDNWRGGTGDPFDNSDYDEGSSLD